MALLRFTDIDEDGTPVITVWSRDVAVTRMVMNATDQGFIYRNEEEALKAFIEEYGAEYIELN